MRANLDLRRTRVAALVSALLALLLPWAAAALLVASPLLFFLPGYAIAAAIFARGQIPWRHMLLLSVGLSIAVLALGALPLNYLPGGVRAGWWALLLVLVVFGGCAAAARRRPARRRARSITWRLRLPRLQAALVVVGAIAIVAAVGVAFQPFAAKGALGYTEMWIQPLEGSRPGVAIGVGSAEQEDSSYRLWVKFGAGEPPQGRYFSLSPGESRIIRLLTEKQRAAAQPVRAALFKEDEPGGAYRRVSTWIPSRESPG